MIDSMNMVMVIARNLLEYFNSLNTYDIVFIGANILLMMLLVTFIYVLKFKDKKEEVTNTIVVVFLFITISLLPFLVYLGVKS